MGSMKDEIRDKMHEIQLPAKRQGKDHEAAQPEELAAFRAANGGLLWVALSTRPDLAYEGSHLAGRVNDLCISDIKTSVMLPNVCPQGPNVYPNNF